MTTQSISRRGCLPEYGAVADLLARLTVLGGLNMDISVTVPMLPGPGATVLGGAAAFDPGGKGANQAVAAARLGAGAKIRVQRNGLGFPCPRPRHCGSRGHVRGRARGGARRGASRRKKPSPPPPPPAPPPRRDRAPRAECPAP
jgi:pfkB family carbohydrate kinase